MGITLRQLIKLCQGIKDDIPFKAALLGGAAGTFVDDSMLDEPMDFDNMNSKGATLGSGAVIIINRDHSIHEVMDSILEFFKHESCRKCIPCRIGTTMLLKWHNQINGDPAHKNKLIDKMIEQSQFMKKLPFAFWVNLLLYPSKAQQNISERNSN